MHPGSLAFLPRLFSEGGVKPSVPNNNGRAILRREFFDEFDLLLAQRRFWWPDVRQLVIVHHTISAHIDSMINSFAKLLLGIIHGASVRENSSLRDVT